MSAEMPWWASDDGSSQLDDQDAFNAHRAARAHGPSSQPEWAETLGDVAVSVVRRFATVPDDRRTARAHVHGTAGAEDPVCRNCPVCSLLRAIDRSGPEVSEHLGDAARHLALAAASFLEALAERPASDEALAERPASDEALAPSGDPEGGS